MERLTIICNAEVVNRGRRFCGSVIVGADGRIVRVCEGEALEASPHGFRVIDGRGMLLLPGGIDEHVHFREPGLTDKADMASESAAAVAGGITSCIDMPNTNPATVDEATLEQKRRIAAEKSQVNYGFFVGATKENLELLPTLDYSRIAGVKLFIGATTGNLVLDGDDELNRLFATVPALIAVHAEDNAIIEANRRRLLEAHGDAAGDLPVELHPRVRSREACVAATRRAVALARRHNHRLHIMHVTTADECAMLTPGDDISSKLITAETCPQYLIFDSADYAARGARIKCNPAVKTAADREALMEAVADGRIDVVGTDHAPHRLADKQGGALKAASGMPMIQWALPMMLDRLAAEDVVRLMCHNPAEIYGIRDRGYVEEGMWADLTLVRHLDTPAAIRDTDVVSRCGWTPLDGLTTRHAVAMTMVNGRVAFSAIDGCAPDPGAAMPLTFNTESLNP